MSSMYGKWMWVLSWCCSFNAVFADRPASYFLVHIRLALLIKVVLVELSLGVAHEGFWFRGAQENFVIDHLGSIGEARHSAR